MRIVFMGTPDFAKDSLEAILNSNHNIIGVVTNPDKPQGRGMNIIESPVKQCASKNNLKIYQPQKIRGNEEFINELKRLNPDLLVVVAYGKILPTEVLGIPKYGAINVHGSLLPKYRGAAPIQWAVINGEKETGITTMFLNEGMDTGDIILKQKTNIGENETTGELWERLSKMGAELLIKTIDKIEETGNNITSEGDMQQQIKDKLGVEKQGENFTLAPMITKDIAKIDWKKSAREIHNLVRGLNPIMGAQTIIGGTKVKIWKTEIIKELQGKSKEAGKIISADKKGLLIQTGDGVISIIELQPESKKKMNYKDFLNGWKITEEKLQQFQ